MQGHPNCDTPEKLLLTSRGLLEIFLAIPSLGGVSCFKTSEYARLRRQMMMV